VKVLAEITLTLELFADASRISLRALRAESPCRCACWRSGYR
jgi:hypothetical protein